MPEGVAKEVFVLSARLLEAVDAVVAGEVDEPVDAHIRSGRDRGLAFQWCKPLMLPEYASTHYAGNADRPK